MSESGDIQQLLARIEDRRYDVEAYLHKARPRSDRLTYTSIISSALAAALTAGPALGGDSFTESVGGAFQAQSDSSVWRVLCILAMVVSVIAAISGNLSKSKNVEARIISAETCNSELETLETLLQFGQVPIGEALKLYQQYIAKVPFIDDFSPGPRARRASSS